MDAMTVARIALAIGVLFLIGSVINALISALIIREYRKRKNRD